MKKYDIVIVGAGPAGIFLCYELRKKESKKSILLIDQGKRVEKRYCPISKGGNCVKCKPFCNITCGFSGAGAFSDGKLSLYNHYDEELYVGGKIAEYIGLEEAKRVIDYTDQIYLEYGADPKLEGVDDIRSIYEYKAKFRRKDLNLVSVPIRHLGTEKAHELYFGLQKALEEMGVDILFNTEVTDLIIEGNTAKGVVLGSEEVYAEKVVIAVGRKGANWLQEMCSKYNIQRTAGIVDIGVRYELPDEVMKDVNHAMYEAKIIGKMGPYNEKVRTFCQNPSGFVSSEVYDDGLTLANGHSYKTKKSPNTNLALLCSHHFQDPFNEPILYGRNIAKNANLIANGSILVQRLGDILAHHRTHRERLTINSVKPTLNSAVAGDISFVMGARTLESIISFIFAVDKVIPGFASVDNLLYFPEIKFYSNEVVLSDEFETSVKGLYSIGDAGGLTRGLMQASASGVHLARVLKDK